MNICLLCRNVESYLPKIINLIQKISKKFGESFPKNSLRIIAVENDSTDRTRQILDNWAWDNENVKLITFDHLKSKISATYRTEVIAYCRNAYIKELNEDISSQNPFSKHEFTLIIDSDDMVASDEFSIDGLMDSIEHMKRNDKIGAIASVSSNSDMDIWALRNSECTYDCWKKVFWSMKHEELTYDNAVKKYVSSHVKNYTQCTNLIPVDSAFNWATVYRTEVLIQCKYEGTVPKELATELEQEGMEICEHVPLNYQIRKLGYEIYMNPMFIVH